MPFPFEKLDVYHRALSLVDEANKLSLTLKNNVPFSMLDQMNRAALSVPLNISEGCGRWGAKDHIHFFRISRGLVFELVPLIQILQKGGFINSITYQKIYGDLQAIAQMFTGLINSLERKLPVHAT
ncbi:hypothetical protein BVX98_02915 [bacterium F11]|nr:hypothetical protein BVX98_02915 [bacterium F11]